MPPGIDSGKEKQRLDEQKKQKKRKITLGKIALALLFLYGFMAVTPYAFPPASDPAAISVMLSASAEADAGKEWAGILESGEEALAGRLWLIEQAQKELRITSYLYACDESGKMMGGALLRAADRGVKIQLLVDGLIGAFNFGNDPLPYALGSHENIEIRYYNPVNLLEPQGLNARLHEKYLIADEKCLILGGRNISDEFLTPEDHSAYNADRDVILFAEETGKNTGVAQVKDYFDALWNSPWCISRFERGGNEEKIRESRAEMTRLLEARKSRPSENNDFFVPVEKCLFLHNPVAPTVKTPWVFDGLCALMENAKKEIHQQSPYFVLDRRMEQALEKIDALPTELTLYTNSMASGNNIMASSDYLWQRDRVAALDGLLYESQTDHSSHVKSLLIDDDLCVFGSFNFDMRSAYIDTEAVLAVYSKPLNEKMTEYVADARALSRTADAEAEDWMAPEKSMPWQKKAIIYGLSLLVFPIRFLL
ncbi:MAG: phospholipase D family protein [Clostridiales bacterium]|nr:phospholipase D family protein [Clostridiales bacterium]